jgi:hypothetical protein
MFERVWTMLLVSGCVANLAACSPYVSWKEEVKLNDGRVIVVEQRKLAEGEIDRESWLTIPLPEFGTKPIVWHGHVTPMNLNVDQGILYVVGLPPTGREARFYGCPEHGYVAFAWKKGTWNRVFFAQIPESIYSTNLLIEGFAPKGTSFLTIAEKNSKTLNGNPRLWGYWKLNPNIGNGC